MASTPNQQNADLERNRIEGTNLEKDDCITDSLKTGFMYGYEKGYRAGAIAAIEASRPEKLPYGYDGDDLNSACDLYAIAAGSWQEIIRYQDGHNLAVAEFDSRSQAFLATISEPRHSDADLK